ncbi:MAG: hypothetical protein ACD_3C00111G0032 [uncultured bacterium (gcode 4)]|uniref:Uncharacterized protein n=1 Tax=uncultured bacterium (gcode 4) TaxID=1234023 RepID=K2GXB4_9BACT|nr:MAG: hypothetical protein ACD_3C00111G0032 [uncultured bacterium (gcode 4)]
MHTKISWKLDYETFNSQKGSFNLSHLRNPLSLSAGRQGWRYTKTALNSKPSALTSRAFTLVELIVVIVILAILWTIAFLSFNSQSSSARDSSRLADVSNIRKGIETQVAMGGNIPIPMNPVIYTWWTAWTWVTWVTITQWILNNTNLSSISAWVKDPSWSEYKYSTFSQWSAALYYQVALELENPTSFRNSANPFLGDGFTSFWDSAASKTAMLKWSYNFDPSLPSLFVLSGSTSSASWWIFNSNLCFVIDWSTTNTFSNPTNCLQKKDMTLSSSDPNLIWYWDMETAFSSWWKTYLKDLSGNGNNWNMSWGVVWLGQTWWIVWNAWIFYTWWIEIPYTPSLNSSRFTIETTFKTQYIWSWTYFQSLINKWDCSSWSCAQTWSFWLWLTNLYWSNSIALYWYDDNLNFFSSDQIPINQKFTNIIWNENWYSIVLRKDVNNVTVFINGTIVLQQNSIKEMGNSFYPLYIGTSWHTRSVQDSPWIMDDTKFYNRALSDYEIRQHSKTIWL